jgi:hypothetical protein
LIDLLAEWGNVGIYTPFILTNLTSCSMQCESKKRDILSIVNRSTISRNIFFALVITLAFFTGSIQPVSAHEPEYIASQNAISIPDPEVSKAYYAELTGKPAVYTIVSDKPFSLYLNLLSPVVPGAVKNFSATVKNTNGNVVTVLDGQNFTWTQWYETFAGDTYWKGPEFRQNVPAGTYVITVSNPTNSGKYVFAPGEKEVFTLTGIPATIHEIYLTKTKFFGKPAYSVFEGIIGKSLLGVLVTLVAVILITFYILPRRRARLGV